jgi:hypothetical protein
VLNLLAFGDMIFVMSDISLDNNILLCQNNKRINLPPSLLFECGQLSE